MKRQLTFLLIIHGRKIHVQTQKSVTCEQGLLGEVQSPGKILWSINYSQTLLSLFSHSSTSLNHNFVHPGWGYQCLCEQDAGPGSISRLWCLRDLQQDVLVSLQNQKKNNMVCTSPATHLSYRQWGGTARGAWNLDRRTSNQAQRKEVKIPVLEDGRGNCGENYSEGDQISLGLEEAKVLELKKTVARLRRRINIKSKSWRKQINWNSWKWKDTRSSDIL